MRRYILCLLGGLLLISCGGGGTTPPAPVIDPPTVLSVNLPALVLLDSTFALNAVVEGGVTAWHWTFDTGSFPATSTDAMPSVRFDARGIFTGTLVAENSGGESAPFTFNYTVVREGEEPVTTNVVALAPLGTIGHAGHPIEFQATAATEAETFEWDFQFQASPTAIVDPSPEIVYRREGTFPARVRAKNPYGFGPWFDFEVHVLPYDGGTEQPEIFDLLGDGEMGLSGGQALFSVSATAFPTSWEWHFGGGAVPDVSVERLAVVTLGAPGLYTGSVRVSTPNRVGKVLFFVYSVGGFEAARMRSQWGGNWTTRPGLGPLAGGRVASIIDMEYNRSPLRLDLDPSCTTQLGLPLAGSDSDPRELANAALSIAGPAGEIDQFLTWESAAQIEFDDFKAGLDDLLHLALTINPRGSWGGTCDLQPGPGEHRVPVQGYSETFVITLDASGQLRWAHALGQSNVWGAMLAISADGSVFCVNVQHVDGEAPRLLRKLSPDGEKLWQTEIMNWPDAMAATPDGGCLLLGRFRSRTDFNPVAPATDVREPLGESDAYLTRIDGNGTYQWTRRWGGAPTFPGSKGADMIASSLIVKPNGHIYAAGTWRVDGVDFQPGSGQVLRFPVPGCDPYVARQGSAYVLQLSPDGLFRSVQTWGADASLSSATGAWLADRPGDNYAVSFITHPCLDVPAQRDLDPGPGSELCASDTTQVVLLIDGAGNLMRKAEWAVDSDFYYSAQAPALFPAPDGGLYAQWQGSTTDLDPGPGVFSGAPVAPAGSHYAVYFDEHLTWSSPLAP